MLNRFASRSKRRTTVTTCSTTPRSPTPSTMRCCATSSRSRAKHPELRTPDSPTQRVGATASERFAAVRTCPADAQLGKRGNGRRTARLRRTRAKNCRRHVAYVCELKIDGLAIALDYREGLLARGGTRGDGRVGEDVTSNLRTIKTIPLRLRARKTPELVEARGEVYLRKSDFERLNKAREPKACRSSPIRAMQHRAAFVSSTPR